MELIYATPSHAFVGVIAELMRAGTPTARPRGEQVLEIDDRVHLVIASPSAGLVGATGRTFNHAISVLEGLSLVGQCSVPEWQTRRVGALAAFQNESVFRGAYGPRVEGSLDDVVHLLERDPDSRQAVLSIYDSHRDLGRWSDSSKSGDVPCTLTIQFLIRRGLLDMWVSMRSNDAWRGLPYDLGQFSILQTAMAQALGVTVGRYTHSAGSMHIYEQHWAWARAVGDPVRDDSFHASFGADAGRMDKIASRCRRMLMGEHLSDATPMEADFISLLK